MSREDALHNHLEPITLRSIFVAFVTAGPGVAPRAAVDLPYPLPKTLLTEGPEKGSGVAKTIGLCDSRPLFPRQKGCINPLLRKFPENQVGIFSTAQSVAPIWGNGHARDVSAMSLHASQLLSGVGFPEAQHPVSTTGRNNSQTVWRKCQVIDNACVFLEASNLFRLSNIPQADSTIKRRGSEQSA
jgi:hypothetical protein